MKPKLKRSRDGVRKYSSSCIPVPGYSHPWSYRTQAPSEVWTGEAVNSPHCLRLLKFSYSHQETKKLGPRILSFKLVEFFCSQWPPPPTVSQDHCFHFKEGLLDKFKSLLFVLDIFSQQHLIVCFQTCSAPQTSYCTILVSCLFAPLCLFSQWFVIFPYPKYW